MASLTLSHRFGADLGAEGGVRFRLWAPGAENVALCLYRDGGEQVVPLRPDAEGWCETRVSDAQAGERYHYIVTGDLRVPDPASRFQPEDVHGPSEVIDPAYAWKHADWRGRPWHEAVIYELHVGTFTPAGTFRAAIDKLDHLADLGVTAIELMPVADFFGRRGWGYDGVLPYAPDSSYGRPEDLKALIDAAHGRGLMVLLDVVYNHFGPEGNYLPVYAPAFFTERHHTPWGAAINFDGAQSRPVRDFFIGNALYWLEEYRFDGLRFDAVHAIIDDSTPDILTEIAETVRARITGRHVHLVLENDNNQARYLGRDGAGRARLYDAQWNDDSHHAFHVLLTGERAGYYPDYAEQTAAHLGRVVAEGFAYQGEASPHRQGAPRGEASAHLPPLAFVDFLQNHDQIGNRAFGERIHALAPPEAIEAALAVLLLAPAVPMLFMGEEWGSTRPFPFFCDFTGELADAVREGRRREFASFPEFQDPAARERIPDPLAEETFTSAKLDWEACTRAPHRERLALCRDLLDLRRREIVPRLSGSAGGGRHERLDGSALRVIWQLGDGSELVLLANLAPEPAAAPSGAPSRASGRLLHASGKGIHDAFAQGQLSPWSALWFIAEHP
jgi:malto-oligosyltrehalose trehalohydrolase